MDFSEAEFDFPDLNDVFPGGNVGENDSLCTQVIHHKDDHASNDDGEDDKTDDYDNNFPSLRNVLILQPVMVWMTVAFHFTFKVPILLDIVIYENSSVCFNLSF
jgi:hypothetical protein